MKEYFVHQNAAAFTADCLFLSLWRASTHFWWGAYEKTHQGGRILEIHISLSRMIQAEAFLNSGLNIRFSYLGQNTRLSDSREFCDFAQSLQAAARRISLIIQRLLNSISQSIIILIQSSVARDNRTLLK
jgi:hypothetical protein